MHTIDKTKKNNFFKNTINLIENTFSPVTILLNIFYNNKPAE